MAEVDSTLTEKGGEVGMSDWISVKDALPETDHEINDGLMSSKPVLVYGFDSCGEDRVLGVARYLRDPNDKDWNEWDGVMMNVEEAMYCDITHWALIPELPKEENT